MSTTHISSIATSLGKFIYIIGTKTDFNFGSYVFEQTMKHAQSFVVKMPIASPSLICANVLNQHPGILVSTDVASKRESPISFHYKLFKGIHVLYIVKTSNNEVRRSTSKDGILAELKDMSMTLEETIKASTRRKKNVDKMILALLAQNEELNEENASLKEHEEVARDTEDENDDQEDHEFLSTIMHGL